MKKELFCIIAVICACLTFSACSDSEAQLSDLQQSYNALQSQLENLQNRLVQNEDELENLQNQLAESGANATQLQQEIDLLTAKIENLSGTPVTHTAEAPVYSSREGYIEYANFDHREDASVSFENFYGYCKTNFINHEFYLLSPIADEDDDNPNRNRVYTVYAESLEDNVAVNPIFYERMTMYSDILGDGKYVSPDSDGYVPWSIDLKFYSMPVENLYDYNGYSLNFKFGYNESGGDWAEYVNISLGGNTFATCYYRTNAYVSSRWLEEYFTKNLVAVKNDLIIK